MKAIDRHKIVKVVNVPELTSEYVKYGCVQLPKLIDDDTVRVLAQESQKLLVGESEQISIAINFFERKEWQSLLWTTPQNVTILYDILGQSPQLDAAIESILAHPVINRLLLDVLGTDYKMWLLQIRRTNPGSDCLRMHQDRPGETCLQILLDDIPSPAGSTVLLPGSDVWPRIINSLPFIDPKYLAPWLRSLTGKKGDMWLFTRTVWHGRLQADSRAQTVLMLSFLPCSARQNVVLPPPNILEQLGPKLQSAIHDRVDLSSSHLAATPELQQLLAANPRFQWWSPWRLAIGICCLFSLALSVWRFCKRR